jgi:hypothetical protein
MTSMSCASLPARLGWRTGCHQASMSTSVPPAPESDNTDAALLRISAATVV